MTLLISTKSNPTKVAGAIAHALNQSSTVELQSVGAGALNQAVKAVAIARGYMAPIGKDVVCIPAFSEVTIENEIRTSIKLIVKVLY